MKYANPGKFKHAIKELIQYIDAGGITDLDEWREEIYVLKLEIDPKDRELFDEVAISKLEPHGLIVSEADEYMKKVLHDFEIGSQNLLKGIKNGKSKKSNR